ncbi:MAG: copper chaperone PCu(A)C [Microthrixaceae bacterium]
MSTAAPAPIEVGPASPERSSRRWWPVVAVLVVAAVAIAAWFLTRGPSGPPELRIERPQAGASPGPVAAVYLTVANAGGTDRLVGASSPAASRLTLHENTGPDGVSLMRRVDSLEVPADGRLELRPGGSHLMLEGLGAPLEEGGRIEVSLRFERSGPRTVEVPVVGLTQLAEEVQR